MSELFFSDEKHRYNGLYKRNYIITGEPNEIETMLDSDRIKNNHGIIHVSKYEMDDDNYYFKVISTIRCPKCGFLRTERDFMVEESVDLNDFFSKKGESDLGLDRLSYHYEQIMNKNADDKIKEMISEYLRNSSRPKYCVECGEEIDLELILSNQLKSEE